MTFNRLFVVLSLAVLAFSVMACGVNEMPQYRNRIQSVRLAPSVDRTAEVLFVSPNVVDRSNPDSVALDVLEQRVRSRLGDRVSSLGHPDLVEHHFGAALADEFVRRFDWDLAEDGGPYDTLFLVSVERYGVSVNAEGVSVAFFETKITGRFIETGTLIYEHSIASEVPLTEIYAGHDPISGAVARTSNLMALDQMSDAQFQAHVLAGAEDAASYLMNELFQDTWD